MKDKACGVIGWMWEPRLGVTVSRREWGLGVTYIYGVLSVWIGPISFWVGR